jgi:hypothetical protein
MRSRAFSLSIHLSSGKLRSYPGYTWLMPFYRIEFRGKPERHAQESICVRVKAKKARVANRNGEWKAAMLTAVHEILLHRPNYKAVIPIRWTFVRRRNGSDLKRLAKAGQFGTVELIPSDKLEPLYKFQHGRDGVRASRRKRPHSV